jgi:predicted negative regulator of RcsB-dependent stress response
LGRIVWGKAHEDTACTYYQLGIVLNAQGDYDRGLRELKKSQEIFERTLGKDHEATARTLHHMGDSYAGNNDTTGALVQYGKALVIQAAKLGRHNPQTVETFRKLDHHMRKADD